MPKNHTMNYEEFHQSLRTQDPPAVIQPPLLALWYDALGDWKKAHEIVQDQTSSAGAWVHGYLHRKEGDLSNARYWYHMAGRSMASCPLKQEWELIVRELL
jgi:hypothetical protein